MANYQAGFNGKVRVNGGIYTAQTWNASEENPEQDVTNTEGIPGNPALPGNTAPATAPAASYIGAINHMRASVTNATFDLLENPFTAPRSIGTGGYINLKIYPAGTTNSYWGAASFYINSASQNGDVRSLQPVTFAGVSDGLYLTP